ncbi:MAG: arylsulfatase A-like enzyme [Salibacteraceae bacterium]|jgi:arylsulfatase A-like enzyme
MKLRSFFPLIILTVIGCNANQKSTTPPPNVLLIMTDDQGWGDLSFHGNDSIYTPNLDKLAQKSCRLEQFYVSPVCAPTRASLLTGRYHLRTGTSWVTHRKEVMRSEELTIAEIFKDAGYSTGCFGKWHSGEQYPNDPNGQGFQEFFGFKAGHWNNYFNTTLSHNQEEVKTEGYITDVLTDKAIDFIRKNKSNPFFCYVPYNAPHSPFQVPDKYFDKYKKLNLTDKNASVHGMIENIDENIGRLLSVLDSSQMLENTIVVFLTDNGPNGQRFNGGMRGIKGSVHEGGVRVPCFVYWKNNLPENQVIKQLSAHIDLLPTLADLCKITIPNESNLDGKSLAPLLKNKNEDWQERSIYTIHTEGENRMKPAAVRTEDYRMVIDYNGSSHLFNMKDDPAEENDLALKQPELLDSLKRDLKNWFTDVTKDAFNVPHIPVGHAKAQTTFLPAPEARLSGNLQFKGGRGWANDYIINWKDISDIAVWNIDVQKNKEYKIALKYNCSEDFVGAIFEVEINGNSTSVPIQEAFNNPFLDSPDRVVRGEVYEKEWGLVYLETPIDSGECSIKLSLKDANNATGWFELKGILIDNQ